MIETDDCGGYGYAAFSFPSVSMMPVQSNLQGAVSLMSNFSALFQAVESLKDEYVAFLKTVTEIESPTDFKEGVDRVGACFIRKAEQLGFRTEVFPQAVSGDVVVITMNPSADAKPVCISGHIDTAHPLGSFGKPTVQTIGNKMLGPGICDCKGGCVCGLWAMDALSRIGYRRRPVMLLLQSDEETSSAGSGRATIDYICRRAGDAAAFLNLETCYDQGSARGLTLERRGVARFQFEVSGIAVHASRCYDGASAIAEAAHKIIELEKYKEVGGTTCSCGLIRGGTAPNTVPDRCTFFLDVRFKDQQGYERIKSSAQEIADHAFIAGTSCVLTEVSCRPAMELTQANVELFGRINEIMEKAGFDRFVMRNSTGGSDAAYTTAARIPTVDSMGIVGNKIHSADEYILIDQMPVSAEKIAAVLYEI